MNIRALHHLHHKLVFLKAWYFLVPVVVFGIIAVDGLRSNYSKMTELRQAVYVADEKNGDVEAALTDLRKHVLGHMNTNLSSGDNAIKPPIQLKYRYERLVAVESEKVKAQNAQITAQAEQQCAAQFPAGGFNSARVSCIQEFVRVRAAKEQPIQDSLYKFDFVSPKWSPDVAGISIVLTIIFSLLFIGRVAIELYMRRRFSHN